VVVVVITVAILGWGSYIGSRRELLWTLKSRAERAEAEQELRTSQARANERARIAREMHDVVAHRMSLIAVQAETAPFRLAGMEAPVRAEFAALSEAARQALAEVRELLGVLLTDGSVPKGLLGKVGTEVSETDAYEAARLTGLAILSSLQRALGDLDRVTGWLRVFGMVNVAPGFTRTPAVINGFSDLILDLWGPEAGAHARSAIGVAELPLGLPVEIEAEVAVD
jgi:enamine deaminase RidA (YjgF/YER057c/UK114 family)